MKGEINYTLIISINQLSVSTARWQHGSQIWFANNSVITEDMHIFGILIFLENFWQMFEKIST